VLAEEEGVGMGLREVPLVSAVRCYVPAVSSYSQSVARGGRVEAVDCSGRGVGEEGDDG